MYIVQNSNNGETMTTKAQMELQIAELNSQLGAKAKLIDDLMYDLDQEKKALQINEAAMAAAMDELEKTVRTKDAAYNANRELERKISNLERQLRDLAGREYRYEQVIDKLLDL